MQQWLATVNSPKQQLLLLHRTCFGCYISFLLENVATQYMFMEENPQENSKQEPLVVFENEHYRWCVKTQKWILKNQPNETEFYKWDEEQQKWISKIPTQNSGEEIDKNGDRIFKDLDGTVYIWDSNKSAWFPKIDDDFLAYYQMNYGCVQSSKLEESNHKKEQTLQHESFILKEDFHQEEPTRNDAKLAKLKRKQTKEPPQWFNIDPQHNTKVYVSNLPLDITLEEFAKVMSKCGMIMRDSQTQKYKLKLYTEQNGQLKGDGLCDYIKVESVDLALNILDGYDLRGNKIKVQRAEFEMRGEYNPSLKPKRKKKDKEKFQKIKERLFDWRPEKMRGERSKNEKIVIIKNLFQPDIFENTVQLILDYQNDLREECLKCGTVRKVIIYDRHVDGVAQVNMSSPEEADLVIQMMHGRFFGKRQLKAQHWDGITKYRTDETEKEVQERISKWNKFLESDNDKKNEDI